jgi:hypothetical protein
MRETHISTCDLFLLLTLKLVQKGKRSEDTTMIQQQMQARLARLKTWDLLTCFRMAQSLDSLHQVPKEVLQGQNGIKGNFSYHREKNTI